LAVSGVPPGSLAAVVIVPVYAVAYARAAVGVKVAVNPLYVTAPDTAVPPGPVTVNVEAVSEAGLIAMLKVALMGVLMATFVAPLAGMVDTTIGTVTTPEKTGYANCEFAHLLPSRPTVVTHRSRLIILSDRHEAPTDLNWATLSNCDLRILSRNAQC
jgi:hypothetical protein